MLPKPPALYLRRPPPLPPPLRVGRGSSAGVGGHYPIWAVGNDPPTGVNPALRPLLHNWEASR